MPLISVKTSALTEDVTISLNDFIALVESSSLTSVRVSVDTFADFLAQNVNTGSFSGSLNGSASYATNSKNSDTASFASGSGVTAVTASYAYTASHALNVGDNGTVETGVQYRLAYYPTTDNSVDDINGVSWENNTIKISGGLSASAEIITTLVTASAYLANGTGIRFVGSASYAENAKTAITASHLSANSRINGPSFIGAVVTDKHAVTGSLDVSGSFKLNGTTITAVPTFVSSSLYAIPTTDGSAVSFAHGLSRTPSFVRVVIYRQGLSSANVNENTYSVGDEIDITDLAGGGVYDYNPVVVTTNSTTINVGSQWASYYLNGISTKDGAFNTAFTVTVADWRIKIYAAIF